jgi:hypothetical protein
MEMNLREIRKNRIEALNDALGPLGMARFLQQFESATGDYTKERDSWLKDFNLDSVSKEIRKTKNRNKT